jgi:hypothetical protein
VEAPSQPLWMLWKEWDTWSIEDRFMTIEQVVVIEQMLASTKFTKCGCMYFMEGYSKW